MSATEAKLNNSLLTTIVTPKLENSYDSSALTSKDKFRSVVISRKQRGAIRIYNGVTKMVNKPPFASQRMFDSELFCCALNAVQRSLDHVGLLAKPREPVYVRFLAKPRELALGVAARFNLRGPDGLFLCDQPMHGLECLPIAQRFKRLRIGRHAGGEQLANFGHQAALEHRRRAQIQ